MSAMADADAEYLAGRYPAALALYERAAASGDARAGEMAGYMLYFGPALFGAGIPCDRARARRWLLFAAENDCPVARMLMRRIDQPRGPPPAFPTLPLHQEPSCTPKP